MVLYSRGHCLFQTVDELINPLTETWDEAILRGKFLSYDVERIFEKSFE
jgi:hypothetical protein